MSEVPADLVINELTKQIADLHRQNAILRVQVTLLQAVPTEPQVPDPTPA